MSHLLKLGTSRGQSGAALTVFLVAGACGTLLGGGLADRYGRLLAIRSGFALAIPSLLGLVLSTTPILALCGTGGEDRLIVHRVRIEARRVCAAVPGGAVDADERTRRPAAGSSSETTCPPSR